MIKIKDSTVLLSWTSDVLLSIYSALLIVSLDAERAGFSWAIKLRLFYITRYQPHPIRSMDDNYGVSVTAFLLVWGLAGLFLVLLRLLAWVPPIAKALRPLEGVAAVAGFPLAVLYIAQGGMAFLQLEVIVGIVFVLLYLYSAWPRSATLCFALLVLHFGVWSWGFQKPDWPGWVLFWPGWNWVWHTGKSVSVVYPLLGFCASLAWGIYAAQQRRNSEKSRAQAPSDLSSAESA